MIGMIISRAVSRFASRLNFYDAILVQDGHELHKIHPPLDLQSRQSLPIAAIANLRPVVIRNLAPEALHEVIDKYPDHYFPVEIDGRLRVIPIRQQILESQLGKDTPEIHNVVTCLPEQTVREVGDEFIQSSINALVVVGP